MLNKPVEHMIPNPLPRKGYIITHLDGTQEYITHWTKYELNKEHKGKVNITIKGDDGQEVTYTAVTTKALGRTAIVENIKLLTALIMVLLFGFAIYKGANKPPKPRDFGMEHKVSIMNYIKENANDPSSYESVGFSFLGRYNDPLLGPDSYYYVHTYRAKNGFGALILTKSTLGISADHETIRMIQTQ